MLAHRKPWKFKEAILMNFPKISYQISLTMFPVISASSEKYLRLASFALC